MNPPNPNYEAVVRASFGQQTFMATLGASLDTVEPGHVRITLPSRDDLSQQDGYAHAGVITSILDSACGYAALTMMAADSEVLSVEFKVNLLRPAVGDLFEARARVIKPGRTITVCQAEAFAHVGDSESLIAAMTATMIRRG